MAVSSAAQGVAMAIRGGQFAEAVGGAGLSSELASLFDTDTHFPLQESETARAVLGLAQNERGLVSLERFLALFPSELISKLAVEFGVTKKLPTEKAPVVEPLTNLSARLRAAKIFDQKLTADAPALRQSKLLLSELAYYQLLLLSRNLPTSALTQIRENIDFFRPFIDGLPPSKNPALLSASLEINVNAPLQFFGTPFYAWQVKRIRELHLATTNLLDVVSQSSLPIDRFRQPLEVLAQTDESSLFSPVDTEQLLLALRFLFPNSNRSRYAIAEQLGFRLDESDAASSWDLIQILPLLRSSKSELSTMLRRIFETSAARSPGGEMLKSGKPLDKLVIVTHPVVLTRTTHAKFSEDLATYLEGSPGFQDVPRLFLISRAYPMANARLASQTTLFRYSSLGELEEPPEAHEVHLMGGAVKACLENSLRSILTTHFSRNPGYRLTVYIHSQHTYNLSNKALSFDEWASAHLSDARFSPTQTVARELWANFFAPPPTIVYLADLELDMSQTRLVAEGVPSRYGPALKFSWMYRANGAEADVILLPDPSRNRPRS